MFNYLVCWIIGNCSFSSFSGTHLECQKNLLTLLSFYSDCKDFQPSIFLAVHFSFLETGYTVTCTSYFLQVEPRIHVTGHATLTLVKLNTAHICKRKQTVMCVK